MFLICTFNNVPLNAKKNAAYMKMNKCKSTASHAFISCDQSTQPAILAFTTIVAQLIVSTMSQMLCQAFNCCQYLTVKV